MGNSTIGRSAVTIAAHLAILIALASPATAQPLNERVLVIYNSAYPDSLEVAQYYAAQRGIPAANLCAISNFDTRDVISWTPMRNAIRACLNTIGPSSILYVVMSYMTPWQVWPNWPGIGLYMLDSYIADIWDRYSTQSFLVAPTGTHGYYGDAQAAGNYFPPFSSFASYRANPKASLIYSVFRLDAATKELAKALVDRAKNAEALPALAGQGCFDMRYGDTTTLLDQSYFSGDWDVFRASQSTALAGFATTNDTMSTEFGTAPSPLTCPNTLLYIGWYSFNNYNNAFTWNPGAIGWHLDSASALHPRSGTNWVKNAIDNGITMTFGSATEPYLEGLPRGGLLRDLFAGANAGDAALRNTRWLRWNLMYFGDPLYRPFPGGRAPFNAPLLENYFRLARRYLVGGTRNSATIHLANIAPPGGTAVNLVSSNPALVSVPASVTVLAGERSVAFNVLSSSVSTQQSVLITGTGPGVSLRNDVALFPLLGQLQLTPASVQGGNPVSATVVLNDRAPLGGALVTLGSGNPAVASVPANVTVPAGATSVSFTVNTSAVGVSTPVTLTATYAGALVEATLTVTP